MGGGRQKILSDGEQLVTAWNSGDFPGGSKSVAGAILQTHLGEMRVPSEVFLGFQKVLKVQQGLYFRDILVFQRI